MILKPSPVRKSPAPLRAALRALMVSACALTAPAAFSHQGTPRRPVYHPPAPTTHPYLTMLVPTPLRFAQPARPPAVLKIEPLPDDEPSVAAPADDAVPAASTDSGNFFGDFGAFNFAVPNTTELDAAIADLDAQDESPDNDSTTTRPKGPPPIILNEDSTIGARPEDIMPFFRLPSAPSKATYRKQ